MATRKAAGLMCGLLNVDLYKSSLLKHSLLTAVFESYDKMIERIAFECQGEIWTRSGDGAVLMFDSIERAIDAALGILDELRCINGSFQHDLAGAVLFTRIGIHVGDGELRSIPNEARNAAHHQDLDVVGKLQKACPIGRVAISVKGYRNLTTRRPLFRPSLSQPEGILAYVLTERQINPQEEGLFQGMGDSQKRAMPPVPFLTWDRIRPDETVTLQMIPHWFERPLLIVLGESVAKHRHKLESAATSDAVGIMEVMAMIRRNYEVRVGLDIWSDTSDLVGDRNILLVGSGTTNAYSFAVNDVMEHLKFVKFNDRVFKQIIAKSAVETTGFGATRTGDPGFVSVARSPFNPSKNLIWVAGVSGLGTQAAALLLKDLVADPDHCLESMGIGKDTTPIGCVVAPTTEPPSGSVAISEYYQRWRINHYRALLAIDHLGQRLLSEGTEELSL